MTRDDHDYYERRARQEEAAASSATCDVARERHQELADAYRFRCSLALGLNKPACSATVIDHPTKTRQPIVSSRSTPLAASPAAAPSPLRRA